MFCCATISPMLTTEPPFDPKVVRAVAGLLGPEAVPSADPLLDVDPEALGYLARYWHVAASLWLRLRDRPGVPATVRAPLRAEYWRNVEANSELRAAAAGVFAALNGQGIVPMVLKGGCQLFDPPGGHAGTRFMVDLDLLAPPGLDRLSFETLCRLGFVPAQTHEIDGLHHWPKLTRPHDGLVVEIHKTPWLGGGAAEAEGFFASSIPIASVAGSALMPSAGHRLLHNAVHALQQEPFYCAAIWHAYDLNRAIGCADLRQWLDFVELCFHRGHELDWEWIVAEADRFGRAPDLQQWAALARELGAAAVPADVAAWNVQRPETRLLHARVRMAAKVVLHRTRLLDPVRRLQSRWLN
jgi:hypothetical protein